MTTDEIIAKYRRHFLGILADSYATRKQAPSELGMTMDRHLVAVEHLIRGMVNDIVSDPPKPLPVETTNGEGKVSGGSGNRTTTVQPPSGTNNQRPAAPVSRR